MKKIKKAGIIAAVVVAIMSMFCVNASAATVTDGLKTDIQVETSNTSEVSVEALLTNQNYYEISGINMTLTVSDNAALKGNTSETDLKLEADGQKSLSVKASLNAQTEESTTATQSATQGATQSTQSTTQKATQSAVQQAVNGTTPTNAVTIGTPKTDSSTVQTGDNNYMLFGGVFIVIAMAAVIIISFKNGSKKALSIMLCATLTLSVVSVSIGTVGAAELSTKTITETKQIEINGQSVTLTLTVEYPQQDEIHDNTMEDIKKLNNGDVDAVLNPDGTISFLNAKYTNYKVTDADTAFNSLAAVSTLLGVADKDVNIVPTLIKTLDNGDVYFTFQQTVGNIFLYNTFLTVGADKDGNTLCISSSINPKTDSLDIPEDTITAEKAEELALPYATEIFGECKLAGLETKLDFNRASSVICWVVYIEKTSPESEINGRYLKAYVDVSNGEIVSVVSISSIIDTDDTYENDSYFKNVTTQMMTFKDYQGKSVELPVAQDKDGQYYFCDTERKIFCADSDKTEMDAVKPVAYTFSTPEEVCSVYVSVYENIRKVYDWYNKNGITSIDGNGIPLLVRFGYKVDGVEQENACFENATKGWGRFTFSNTYISTALDVVAHEFSHGVKRTLTGESEYANATGAVEESYADILGNLSEMIIDPDNSDTETWLLGEATGKAMRSMSNPHQFAQPKYIGDAYYVMSNENFGVMNDNGAVHGNNSILSNICYKMYKSGISMEDDFKIWFNTLAVFNPYAEYSEVAAYVKYSAERNGLTQYANAISTLFDDAKIDESNTITWESCPVPDGYTKIIFEPYNIPDKAVYGVDWIIENGYNIEGIASIDGDGTYGMITDSGNALLYAFDDNGEESITYLIKPYISEECNYILEEGTIRISVNLEKMAQDFK